MSAAIPCRTAQELISWRLDRPLDDDEAKRLLQHLETCEPCRRVERQLQLMRFALTRLAD